MTQPPITSYRPLPSKNHWASNEPPEQKAAREKAWQEYKCCRDCKFWSHDESEIGYCQAPEWNNVPACFRVPEDYHCSDFVAGKYEEDNDDD